ncbi:MAG: LON peptidase substrate-binding domain-containing protein [Planctomycetota bacterium]
MSPPWNSKSFEFDREAFSGRVPLFPLPRTVLLPGSLIPLHVFEPRYRVMIKDALAGERLIGLALLRPGYEEGYHGAPEIEPWVGVGRLLAEEQLDDGRYNVLVLGVARGKVVEEDRTRPYRVAGLELPPELPATSTEVASWGAALLRALETTPPRFVRDPSRLDQLRTSLEVPLDPARFGAVVDLAGGSLHLGVTERQRLLAAAQPYERVRTLQEIAESRQRELALLPGVRPWRHGFSRN